MTNGQLDFVAIGDITTDAFIDLKNANVWNDGGIEKLCVRFGDKIEYDDVTVVHAVGNSPNAATSAKRLGLNTGLVTHVGDDKNGDDCVAQLEEEGISTRYVSVQVGQKTNYHYVLRHDAERTILIKHYEYNYKLPNFGVEPKWMYFSSIGENSLDYHHEIAKFVHDNPETKLAFQPGTFQIKLGYETLSDLYKACEIFFCNKEEAQRILQTTEDHTPTLAKEMRKLGPNIAIITDGVAGAFAANAKYVYHIPMYPDPAPPVDRTGAGDSFSSTVTALLAQGLDLDDALMRGPINSMSVVQYIGAQKGLLSRDKIEKYLKEAPKDYRITIVA